MDSCGHCLCTYSLLDTGEVDDLLNSATSEEKGVQGRTRGVKNDAYKQEKEMDNAFAQTGVDE